MAIFKSYLTSLEPDMSQAIYSQSIGGFYSNSLLYPETTLTTTIGLYDTSITLDNPGGWDDWQGVEYINIGNEVMRVSPMTMGSVTVVTRGYNGIINMHIATDIVRAVSAKELFNDVFDENHKQYRCIAMKNNHGSTIAYNFEVYLKQNSRSDDSSIKIALEQPSSQYWTGTSESWTTMTVVDADLIDLYDDNHFNGAYLKLLSGDGINQGKLVASFDSSTGTFGFYSSFSSEFSYVTAPSYEVLPSPAQRIKTGIVSPVDSGDNVIFPFVSTSEFASLRFATGEPSNPAVTDLSPGDVIYVWLERTIDSGVENFDNNDVVLNIKYDVSA